MSHKCICECVYDNILILQVLEYCNLTEPIDVSENAFNLIFAFDEIVALGYRESVNLAQIKTFVEMDSHEEKVYQAVRMTQEREAKNKMREKAKELQRQRMEARKNIYKNSTFNRDTDLGNVMSMGMDEFIRIGEAMKQASSLKSKQYDKSRNSIVIIVNKYIFAVVIFHSSSSGNSR